MVTALAEMVLLMVLQQKVQAKVENKK